MAEFLHFSRDSRLYMEKDGYFWSIPVLDGFSFSQATNATEITLNEMEDASGRSRRGRKMFTDSLSAAEFSFSTYIRPFKSAGSKDRANGVADSTVNHHHAVEEALWVAMAGQNVYVPGTGKFKHGATGGAISGLAFTSSQGSGNNVTDSDRTAGTYTIAVPTAASGSNTGATVSGGSVQGGTNAVIQVVINGSGTATSVTVTERGTGFDSANKIIVDSLLIGGAADDDNLSIDVTSESFTSDATDLDINFFDSSRASLGTFNLYFVFSDRSAGRLLYKLQDAVINEASIDFDIDGIATIAWSGNCANVLDFSGSVHTDNTLPANGDTTADTSTIAVGDVWLDANDGHRLYVMTNVTSGAEAATEYVNEAITNTTNFIRNRLTVLTVTPTSQDPDNDSSNELESSYNLTLTGGNVTISNNITFITPEELGIVNVPIGHVTGTRSVSGSFTCYLTEDTGGSVTNVSRDFFEDLRAITNVVTNSFALVFKIGGASGTGLELNMATAHVEIPTHSIEDVISLETNFQALPSTIVGTDELALTYRP